MTDPALAEILGRWMPHDSVLPVMRLIAEREAGLRAEVEKLRPWQQVVQRWESQAAVAWIAYHGIRRASTGLQKGIRRLRRRNAKLLAENAALREGLELSSACIGWAIQDCDATGSGNFDTAYALLNAWRKARGE